MRLFLPVLLILAAAAGCGAADAVDASNRLGIQALRDRPPGDAAVSPLSLRIALLMTWTGAAGDTRREMAEALGFDDDSLRAVTELRAQMREASKKGGIVLSRADRLFGQKGFPFAKEFLDGLKRDFDAPLDELDFARNPEKARSAINGWVGKATKGRIEDLIPRDGIAPNTVLVLADALYFKAPWETPFEPRQTAPAIFRLDGEKNTRVPTMQGQCVAAYSRREGLTVVGLPYANPEFQFVVLMPDSSDGLAELEARLDPALLRSCAKIPLQEIDLHLPRFRVETESMRLSKVLKGIGIAGLFEPGRADLSGMLQSGATGKLWVSEVFQKVFVDVRESGTEAAAATAVVVGYFGLPPENPPAVFVNRPFLFAIQHRPSGACLFLGRVTDPR